MANSLKITVPARRSIIAAASASMVVAIAGTSAVAEPSPDTAPKTENQPAVPDSVIRTNAALSVDANASYAVDTASIFGTADAATAPEPEPVVEEPVRTETAADRTDTREEVAPETTETAATDTTVTEQAATQETVEAPATQTETPAVAPSSGLGSAAVSIALQYTGAPSSWGGTTPAGWDCIGFVSYVYRQLGYEVGSTPSAVLSAGTRVPASQAQPGDIMYWPGHVAIYLGNGQNVAAWNPGMGTTVGPNSWLGAPTYIRVG
jgi:cell wall-associated NlpC family hydrolase